MTFELRSDVREVASVPARLVERRLVEDRLTGRNTVMIARDNNTVAELSGAARALLVPAEHLPAAAYCRDRWAVDDDPAPLGSEPPARRSTQHRDWDHLSKQLGPTGTLRQLAELRDYTSDPTRAVAVEDAMSRRRDAVTAAAAGGERPPQWGAPIVGFGAWSNDAVQAQRERDTVAKTAIYRDRFAVTGPGVGDQPVQAEQRRIWQTLRVEIAASHGGCRSTDAVVGRSD